MAKPAKRASLEEIRAMRARIEDRLLGKRNAVGSMIGLKLKGGLVLDTPVLTVFVDRKVSPEDLKAGDRIPRRLTIDGRVVHTDVIEFTGLFAQASFPATGALSTHDGTEYGTLSSFARSAFGAFGLTCAHAIEGLDQDPYTQSPVGVFSPALSRPVPVGVSAMALAGGGAGVPGAFGFSDAALFTLEHPELLDRAIQGATIPVAAAREGERVFGAGTTGPKSGTVIGFEQQVGADLVDVVIQVDAPGTYRGDSGLLWRNSDGDAVAIHAKGDGRGPGVGSSLTAAMDAGRAAAGLAVELVDG